MEHSAGVVTVQGRAGVVLGQGRAGVGPVHGRRRGIVGTGSSRGGAAAGRGTSSASRDLQERGRGESGIPRGSVT